MLSFAYILAALGATSLFVSGQELHPCLAICLAAACPHYEMDLQCVCSSTNSVKACIRGSCPRVFTPSELEMVLDQYCGNLPFLTTMAYVQPPLSMTDHILSCLALDN